MKICCYGDSNTWGYDPRSPLGEQLPAPWPEQLSKLLGCKWENWGSCGRCIPHLSQSFTLLQNALLKSAPDKLIILLGTNDILTMEPPRAEQAAFQMENLIRFLKEQLPELPILLLSPPKIRIPGEELQKAMKELPAHYRRIAQSYGLSFLDLQALSLPLAYDGVHLSQEGHRLLAQALAVFLSK